MPSVQQRPIYSSGKWEVDLTRRELRAFGTIVPIGGRAFDIIEVLVQSAGQLVTKDQLIDRVWGCATIEENAIQAQICAIRKSFGPDRELLQTVSRRGYRLLGTWTTREGERSAASIDRDTEQTSVRRPGSNLPVPTSALVGREIAVRQLQELLSLNRVVTLTGAGGIGKTSLSLELARCLLPSFGGEIRLVELNALPDPSRVPSAVGRIIGLSPGGDAVSSASIAHAVGTGRMLLVIDNCEHLVEATAELAGTILSTCPNVSVLATSREALRVDGEYVYRVPALDVPAQDLVERESIMSYSAVRLFIARIAALNSDLLLSQQDFRAIAEICRRLDGIPLAIEFAAERASTLGLLEVAQRLDDRFNLLISGRRTSLPRHRSLRAMLDWSYEFLPQGEQKLLRHLAVFAAGFTIDAANAAIGMGQDELVHTANRLANLVGKSLVVLDSSVADRRWRLLETIRAYALDKLSECGETDKAIRNHAHYHESLGSSGGGPFESRICESQHF